jgi:ribosomal protein S18 acetylase RimI-like enzyme
MDAQIAAALQLFRERGYPMFWWVGPSTRPADLGARLLANGLVDDGAMPGMAIALSELRQTHDAPPGLAIEQVSSPQQIEDFTVALRAGYGVPDVMQEPLVELGRRQLAHPDGAWQYFVGRLAGEPVAASQLFLHAAVAGVYAVATAPSARRQGIGEALTRAALLAGMRRGYHVGILQASAMGQPIYERQGFRSLTSFHLYLLRSE